MALKAGKKPTKENSAEKAAANDLSQHIKRVIAGGKAATADANSLNREFGTKLKEHMQYRVDQPKEMRKLAKVKA
ncbi:hypothetical protein AMTR_s00199p00019940 [Amborella trichopoda]|uniref:Uncharacterized protein n=1 Tax=Amborella trichopoda TaxID=13333 RepID=U5D8C4_AMBTC|nr:hypothetical protein AMTR_s00199p00019940 [Amborella trichopoda]